jgi:hypothetical protein
MRVYIAGPYTKGDVACNVKRVIDIADEIANLGHIPFVPHLFHFWHLVHPHPKEFWMKMDLIWLANCDILFLLEGESEGTKRETDVAKIWDIPVVTSTSQLEGVRRVK